MAVDLCYVVTPAELGKVVRVHYWWWHDVQVGDMLDSVASYDLHQTFTGFHRVTSYTAPPAGKRALTLELSVASYHWGEGGRAELTLHAVAHGADGFGSFEKDYPKSGSRMGNQVASLSAAIRHSTLEAYQSALDDLRKDLFQALHEPSPAVPADQDESPDE